MTTDELREKYLEFFVARGHRRVASDVLVPRDDPSVLFTPAGMNQFKDHFLGKVKLEFTRATSCQKCLRTGDIDNVGRTAYHHTFFEMLGNFSFGDYFKREAIQWAWQFVTEPRWLGIDPNRLSVSVYLDDDEAAKIWHDEIGLPTQRVARKGEDENFWPASAPTQGPDGVCGPCSEIFYHDDNDHEVEIWNLVFTQFNRQGPPPDNLHPLPSKNIDTGMGLERTAAVLQGVDTNYHIDILKPLVLAAAEACHVAYEPHSDNGRRLRRIADHVRACTMAIHENVEPDSQKQGYVVRRLLRRAVLDGHQMSMREPFLFQLVDVVARLMHRPYPELRQTVARVAEEIRQEEAAFLATLDEGMERVESVFRAIERSGTRTVGGEQSAALHTTFGVPPELLEQLANERGLQFDWSDYRRHMEEHGRMSGGWQREVFQTGPIEQLKSQVLRTEFTGYGQTTSPAAVQGIVRDGKLCEELADIDADQPAIIVLDQTPFYGEAGGQVGDTGWLHGDGTEFEVTDTQRASQLVLHFGFLRRGRLRVGSQVAAEVDATRRLGIRRAHSATHVLHYALRHTLGEHAQQRGSKVDDDWLRFDFRNRAAIEPGELESIESTVIDRIAQAAPISIAHMPIDEARQAGAMMLFGEKYPDIVRVVTMGQFSRELCGGTHLNNTAEIGEFELLSDEAVSAGTRRVTALTGAKAAVHRAQVIAALARTATALECAPSDVPAAVETLVDRVRRSKKHRGDGSDRSASDTARPARSSPTDLEELPYVQQRRALAAAARRLNVPLFDVPDRVAALLQESRDAERAAADQPHASLPSAADLLARGSTVGDITMVVSEVVGASPDELRKLVDELRNGGGRVATFLASIQGTDKIALVAGLSPALVKSGLSAGDWVRQVAPLVGGGGGGRADMAQAGGKNPLGIKQALAAAIEFLRAATVT